MNEFDIKAAGWDENPMHRDRSEAIAVEIKRLIPLNTEMKVLEYGAGTGITSFLLKDHVKEITLMDNSSEMVKVMAGKIKTSKVRNLKVLNFNLEQSDYKNERFDLIFTQMVLHHVSDIDLIISRFYKLLNPGGFLAIADLYPEDGSFHGDGFTGHRGFDVETLSTLVRNHGFTDISHRKCFVINKKISASETKQFDVFMLISSRC
ncbi:MAG TPA: class I SAM-dependent methyltransferase [Bacteroidales bacterium]|jgi:tRNA (cmo5U34)-methyltransferase|nr:class I SAM-dependent methyltransferase [Bacteroidales bacterium]HBZ21327.1 class I SAM-dependent methyltransferase [Bacteroidales bacterium]